MSETTRKGPLPARRRSEFVRYITEAGQATVTELSDAFGVSLDTVRRDLDLLSDEGVLTRTHGGAVLTGELATAEKPFANRVSAHREAKEAIAKTTAGLISNGETLVINGGTTTLAVVRALGGKRDLTVVTNNLLIPGEAPEDAIRDLYVIGGGYRSSAMVTLGPVGFPGARGISADVAVIGVGGVSAECGFSTSTLPEAQMMREMIESAGRVLIVADSSKFGRNAFAHICALATANALVTEARPGAELSDGLADGDVRLVLG